MFKRKCYVLSQDEATYILAKYNNEIRARVVSAFYKLKEMYEKGEITQTSMATDWYLESINNLIRQTDRLIKANSEKDALIAEKNYQMIKEREAQTAQIQKMIDLHEKLIYSITDKREVDEEDKEYRLKLSDLKETLHINPRLNLTKILINEGVIEYSGIDEYLDFTEEYRNCGERGNNNILYKKFY